MRLALVQGLLLVLLWPSIVAAGSGLPPDPFALFASRRAWDPILDGVAPCLPDPVPEALAGVMPYVQAGDESATRRVLEVLHKLELDEGRGITPQLHLWIAVLRARAADTNQRRVEAARAINRALAWGGEGHARVCAYLERARAELATGRSPEASASALQALREAGEDLAPSIRDSLLFLRAEALRLAARGHDAASLYEELASSSQTRLAAAARLRLADEAPPEADPKKEWESFRALLEEARLVSLSLVGFEHRATERALRAGDSRRALKWISRAADLEGNDRFAGLASIRKADVLVLRDRREDARRTLQRVAEVDADPDIRRLARLRLAVHELVAPAEADLAAAIDDAIDASERGLVVHARGLLLKNAVAAGEFDAALSYYARLTYSDPNEILAPGYRDDLDAALEAAVDPHCPTTVRRLGGRRDLLMREARVFEPFIALADCFLALGMPRAALNTYRIISRSFGPSLVPRLTLRLARASLGAGDLPAVHAALRAYKSAGEREGVPSGGLAGDSWPLFEAELALREGRKKVAAGLLRSLAEDPEIPIRALQWLADLAREGFAPESTVGLLEGFLARWQLDGEELVDGAARASLALAVADLRLIGGDHRAAHYHYGLAAEGLKYAAPRARSLYLRATLTENEDARMEAYHEAALAAERGPWSRLAALKGRARELRTEVSLDEPAALLPLPARPARWTP